MVDIWRENATVRFGDVDRSNRLTLWSMFSFFQEAAISHAADLGVGLNDLEHSKQAWILSRLSLFIGRRPFQGELVQVSTWPRRSEKLFALRDYEIQDKDKNAVIRGRGGWLVIDVEKRRPLRVEPIMEPLPANEGINAFHGSGSSKSPSALSPRDNFSKIGERTALYSDIDYYGHANNARYIQWVQDCTDADLLTKAGQARLDINYLSEVLPGDTVELWTAPLEDPGPRQDDNPVDYPVMGEIGFAYEARRPDSGQAVFRAELRIGRSDQDKAG